MERRNLFWEKVYRVILIVKTNGIIMPISITLTMTLIGQTTTITQINAIQTMTSIGTAESKMKKTISNK